MSELYYAEMEAARNEAADAYFKARPQVNTRNYRQVFNDGFERAFRLLWKEPAQSTEPTALNRGGAA